MVHDKVDVEQERLIYNFYSTLVPDIDQVFQNVEKVLDITRATKIGFKILSSDSFILTRVYNAIM